MEIKLMHNVGSQVWGIYDNPIKPIELMITGYKIHSLNKSEYEIIYLTHKAGDSSKILELPESEVYPTKQAVILKMKEIEELRHLDELKRIDSYSYV